MLKKIDSDIKNYANVLIKNKKIDYESELLNKNIVLLQDFTDSIGSLEEENKSSGCATIGIADTMKKCLGIELELYKDTETGKLYLKEKNNEQEYLLVFNDNNTLAEYIECLIYFGIYCKLSGVKANINRSSNIKRNIEGIGELKIINSELLTVTIGEKVINCSIEKLQETLKEWIKNKAFTLNINDIMHAGLSQYEARKMIAVQYDDISLNNNEIESLAFYKAGYFKYVNCLLRGTLNIRDAEKGHFYQSSLAQIIDIIINIYTAMQKFVTDRDIWLLRGITHFEKLNSNIGSILESDSFLSTSRTSKLFNYRLEGVSYRDFLYICIPKGSHFVPMDLIAEKRMNDSDSFSLFHGSTGKDEGEYLLPMCALEVLENDGTFEGRRMLKLIVRDEFDLFSILLRRIMDLKDEIIKYADEEKYEYLLEKVKGVELQDDKKIK